MRSFLSFRLVGGIYTVIRTKAGVTVEELGDDYILIGPYNHEQCQTGTIIFYFINPLVPGVH